MLEVLFVVSLFLLYLLLWEIEQDQQKAFTRDNGTV